MRDDELVLRTVREEGAAWIAELSFRGRAYEMAFAPNRAGNLRLAAASPLALTAEGRAVADLVERVRAGEPLSFPRTVAGAPEAGLASVHDPGWSDRSEPAAEEAWLDGAERTGEGRWAARLRLDGAPERFELEVFPGPVVRVLHAPPSGAFQPYAFDLTRLLIRMEAGERFALPFRLRPRWPTPPDAPALGA